MKISSEKTTQEKPFIPFNLILTVESNEEAQALYCLFNYTPTCNYLRIKGVDAFEIKKEININFNGKYKLQELVDIVERHVHNLIR
jgi:hypothetical protein